MDTYRCVTATVEKWRDVLPIREAFGSRYLFRGQCNSDWPLSTRLERDLDLVGMASASRKLAEEDVLDRFRRRARFYTGFDLRDSLEWLALLQHHGGPTRLFDVTRSFFIATFFAIDGARGDVAVWAFHSNQLILGADRVLGEDYGRFGEREYRAEVWKRANQILSERSRWALVEYPGRVEFENPGAAATVLVLEPETLFDRIAIQQGVFLFPTNLQVGLEECLAKTFGWDQLVLEKLSISELRRSLETKTDSEVGLVKLVLKRGALPAIARDLHAMNVNAASIYPGLDGFARSLSPLFSPTQFDPASLSGEQSE